MATDRGRGAVERGGESSGTRRERVHDDADGDVGGLHSASEKHRRLVKKRLSDSLGTKAARVDCLLEDFRSLPRALLRCAWTG